MARQRLHIEHQLACLEHIHATMVVQQRPQLPTQRGQAACTHRQQIDQGLAALQRAGQRLPLRPFNGLRLILGNKDVTIGSIPRRNLVPPPQLPRDTPGLDILHPVEIGVFPGLRHKVRASLAHRGNGRLCKALRISEPLVRQHRFDNNLRTVTEGLHDLVVLDEGNGIAFLVHRHDGKALGGDVRNHLLARLKPVQSAILVGNQIDAVNDVLMGQNTGRYNGGSLFGTICIGFTIIAQCCLHIHQPVAWNAVALGNLIVVEVMGTGNLNRA